MINSHHCGPPSPPLPRNNPTSECLLSIISNSFMVSIIILSQWNLQFCRDQQLLQPPDMKSEFLCPCCKHFTTRWSFGLVRTVRDVYSSHPRRDGVMYSRCGRYWLSKPPLGRAVRSHYTYLYSDVERPNTLHQWNTFWPTKSHEWRYSRNRSPEYQVLYHIILDVFY